MKILILAGGYGSRLKHLTKETPKPMLTINEKPLLVYVQEIYAKNSFCDFMICGGYKVSVIDDYYSKNKQIFDELGWNIKVVDSGLDTMTAGRIKRCFNFSRITDTFMVSYGDTISNVDIAKLLSFHKKMGKKITITAFPHKDPYGEIILNKDRNLAEAFIEKRDKFINIGYYICEPEIVDLIDGDSTIFESEVIPKLVEMGEASVFIHEGFWKTMNNRDEYKELEDFINQEKL